MLGLQREKEARCEVDDRRSARHKSLVVSVFLIKISMDKEGQIPDDGEAQP